MDKRVTPTPFALSLSKGFPSSGEGEGKGFDKLSPNGFDTPSGFATETIR
jgi:hypothetical protein